MPGNLTIAELKDRLGDIVLLTARDAATGKNMQFTADDLPLPAIVILIRWLNSRLP